MLTSVVEGDILNFVVEQSNLKEQNDEKVKKVVDTVKKLWYS